MRAAAAAAAAARSRALRSGMHTVVWTADGKLYSFGLNMHGQLGTGAPPPPPPPTTYVAPQSVWAALGITIDESAPAELPDDGAASAQADVVDDEAPKNERSPRRSPARRPRVKSLNPRARTGLRAELESEQARANTPELQRRGNGQIPLSALEEESLFEDPVPDDAPWTAEPTLVDGGALSRVHEPGVVRAEAGWRNTFIVLDQDPTLPVVGTRAANEKREAPDTPKRTVSSNKGRTPLRASVAGSPMAASMRASVVDSPHTAPLTPVKDLLRASEVGDDEERFQSALAQLGHAPQRSRSDVSLFERTPSDN